MKNLASMHIMPANNGGFRVRHQFKPSPQSKGGSMSGGVEMQYHQPEEHVFGADEGEQMVAHVAKHLGIRSNSSE